MSELQIKNRSESDLRSLNTKKAQKKNLRLQRDSNLQYDLR